MGLPFILEAPWQVTVPHCGIIEFQSAVVPCTLHAFCEDVAAGVPPAVEGGVPPPGPTFVRGWQARSVSQFIQFCAIYDHRAGRPVPRQAGCPPPQNHGPLGHILALIRFDHR